MAYKSAVDVFLLLVRSERVLLALRAGTGFADGWWNLPSGKVERGEDAAAAAVREAREEIGLDLAVADLRLVATVHEGHRAARGARDGRLGLFFLAERWDSEPVNAEPHKCAGIEWFPLDGLPANTWASTRAGVELHRRAEPFAAIGWEV
jgi:8-oxo-dGTP pyrophosphatase MutT (NUDIX family)